MENVNFVAIFISLIFTALLYGIVPIILYSFEKDLSKKKLKKILIANSIIVYIILFIYYIVSKTDKIPNAAPSFFWGIVYYELLNKYKYADTRRNNNQEKQVGINQTEDDTTLSILIKQLEKEKEDK